MTIKTSLGIAVLATIPMFAQAQEFLGGVTLGYGSSNISGVTQDITTRTFDGRVEVAFGNGLSFGARYDRIDASVDGVALDLTGDMIGLDLGYAFGNGFAVGLYNEKAKIG
ncbi:MAG: outer membrane beta-barrel protein, partial [Rhodobacteraceae bacterium]|nr:outer membrane beta-barrel protein [Paracoccaceae bacterium]